MMNDLEMLVHSRMSLLILHFNSDKYCMFEQNPLYSQSTYLKKYRVRFVFFQAIQTNLNKQKTTDLIKDELTVINGVLEDVANRIRNITETIETTNNSDGRDLRLYRLDELGAKKKSLFVFVPKSPVQLAMLQVLKTAEMQARANRSHART